MKKILQKLFQRRLKLIKGTRFTSFLFIALSVLIASAILFAANIYYNIDTGEIVMEHIERVTQVIRATAGLIVGGSATQNPASGYQFQVVGQSLLATTSISASNQLRFFDSDNTNYVGFRAPDALSENTSYVWPSGYPLGSGYVLTSDTSGVMSWVAAGTGGIGDITQVGDCVTGDCFTQTGGSTSTTLWFRSGNYRGALTVNNLTANATYTLPAVSAGNYYFSLIPSTATLTTNRLVYASGPYTLADNANFTLDTDSRTLIIGSANNAGMIRIYSNNSNYLQFTPVSGLSSVTTYYWPTPPSDTGYVLTADSAGYLSWTTLGGLSGITGSGSTGQVAFFTGTNSIGGSANFSWSTSTNVLTITGALNVSGIITGGTFTGPSGATTTITSASGQNILLDPASGRVYLGSEDYIITAGGYEIGKKDKEILKEMVPIMGFDLPVKTATSGTVQISRTIVNYPLNPCEAGTSRVHKLVIRYGSEATTSWAVATSTGNVSTFQLPPNEATSTGSVYTVEVNLPTPSGVCTGWSQGAETDDWWVTVSPNSNEIMIYQIFLAGYDKIL